MDGNTKKHFDAPSCSMYHNMISTKALVWTRDFVSNCVKAVSNDCCGYMVTQDSGEFVRGDRSLSNPFPAFGGRDAAGASMCFSGS